MSSMKEFNKTWSKDFKEFWLPNLKNRKGKLSLRKISNELHDLVYVMEQAQSVYCEVTKNKLSKPMYPSEVIIGEFEQYLQDERDEGFKEGKLAGKEESEGA